MTCWMSWMIISICIQPLLELLHVHTLPFYVLQGIYDDSVDEELNEIMKLVLKNCVQIAPLKTNPEITVAKL